MGDGGGRELHASGTQFHCCSLLAKWRPLGCSRPPIPGPHPPPPKTISPSGATVQGNFLYPTTPPLPITHPTFTLQLLIFSSIVCVCVCVFVLSGMAMPLPPPMDDVLQGSDACNPYSAVDYRTKAHLELEEEENLS